VALLDEEEKKRKRMKMIGIYMTIPFVLAVPPIVGWLIGTWLDKKLETSPYLMYVLLILGFAAGIREFYRIIKTYGQDEF
jgi:ATP synthase protein I